MVRFRATRFLEETIKLRPITLLFALVANFLSFNVNAWPWDSCDKQWQNVWARCQSVPYLQCHPMSPSLAPTCDPADPYLREFPGGRQEYEANQRFLSELARANAEKLRQVSILRYRYVTQLGKLTIDAEIVNANHSDTLRELGMLCRVIANNAIELHHGRMTASPRIVGGGRAWVRLRAPDEGRTIDRFNPVDREEISTLGQDVATIDVQCESTNAVFWPKDNALLRFLEK